MTKHDDDQLALFEGFRPVGTKLSVSGSITTATAQPARDLHWREEVTLLVRGYIDKVEFAGGFEDVAPTRGHAFKVTEAYEVDEKTAEDLIDELRAEVQAAIDRRLGESLQEAS